MTQLYLIARIAGRAVAILSDQVESVVDIGEITAVPRAGAHVCGLAALRSRVVTVVNTRSALGMNDAQACEARRAVITLVDGHHYAMLVEVLEDVAPFDLLPLSNGIALEPAWHGAARGIVERGGEPVLVIDLAALIPGQGQGFVAAQTVAAE